MHRPCIRRAPVVHQPEHQAGALHAWPARTARIGESDGPERIFQRELILINIDS